MSDSKMVYFYDFSIDELEIGYAELDKAMCFISDDIDLGELRDDTYIQLSASYDAGLYGSVEFYIEDSLNLKPILPIEDLKVVNEKIFPGLEPRFPIDTNDEIIIKNNNIKVDISLDDAINSSEGNYTVSYTPVNPYDVKVSNQHIRIKVILRCYDNNKNRPLVRSIIINKYGGSFIWD